MDKLRSESLKLPCVAPQALQPGVPSGFPSLSEESRSPFPALFRIQSAVHQPAGSDEPPCSVRSFRLPFDQCLDATGLDIHSLVERTIGPRPRISHLPSHTPTHSVHYIRSKRLHLYITTTAIMAASARNQLLPLLLACLLLTAAQAFLLPSSPPAAMRG